MMESLKSCDSTVFLRCINYILDTVDRKGAWGGKDFEDWEPIITALTLELFLDLGLVPETEWVISKGITFERFSMLSTLKYLGGAIRDDGSFGEDLWDAARLGGIIERYDLKDRIGEYSRLKRYLYDAISRGDYKKNDSTWSGPGTISSIIDYLDSIHDTKANELFNDLLTLQFSDGSFHGPINEVNDELVHPIWHTTLVLMTALRRIPSEKDERIQKMVNFICSSQDKTKGCWRAFSHYGVYFTAYAIIALNCLSNKPRENIQKALFWLSSEVSENGKIRDAGGTIMGAIALFTEYRDQLTFKTGIIELRQSKIAESIIADLNVRIQALQVEITNKNNELDTYKKKFNMADIVLTKADAFKWAILLGIVGIGVSFFLGFLPQLISKAPQPIFVPLSQQQIEQILKNSYKNSDIKNIFSKEQLKMEKQTDPGLHDDLKNSNSNEAPQ